MLESELQECIEVDYQVARAVIRCTLLVDVRMGYWLGFCNHWVFLISSYTQGENYTT